MGRVTYNLFLLYSFSYRKHVTIDSIVYSHWLIKVVITVLLFFINTGIFYDLYIDMRKTTIFFKVLKLAFYYFVLKLNNLFIAFRKDIRKKLNKE